MLDCGLEGPSVASQQGPLHLHENLGVVLNRQEFSHHRLDKNKYDRKTNNLRFGTWNIGTLTDKLMEVVDMMIRRKISILCVQETKWIGEKAKMIENSGFKLWYTGKSKARNGVGIIVDSLLKDEVVGVVRKGDRIIALKIIVAKETMNIISVYAPQVRLDEATKSRFWEDLDEILQNIPPNEMILI